MLNASALLRYGDPSFGPRAMVIDFGGWDDHTEEGPTAPGGNYGARR